MSGQTGKKIRKKLHRYNLNQLVRIDLKQVETVNNNYVFKEGVTQEGWWNKMLYEDRPQGIYYVYNSDMIPDEFVSSVERFNNGLKSDYYHHEHGVVIRRRYVILLFANDYKFHSIFKTQDQMDSFMNQLNNVLPMYMHDVTKYVDDDLISEDKYE